MTCVQGSSVGKKGITCSVSLPFILSRFWLKVGQYLLQLVCPPPFDMTRTLVMTPGYNSRSCAAPCRSHTCHTPVCSRRIGDPTPGTSDSGWAPSCTSRHRPFLANQETVGENLVSSISSGGDEDDVAACLATGPSVCGLDPVCMEQ